MKCDVLIPFYNGDLTSASVVVPFGGGIFDGKSVINGETANNNGPIMANPNHQAPIH